jgi:hypothetical protein
MSREDHHTDEAIDPTTRRPFHACILKVPDDARLDLYGSIRRGTTPATIQYSRK